MDRLIAIGDIHGQRSLLADLLEQIDPRDEDQFVFLGDYIDRGPNSKGVIEDLINFQLLHSQTLFLRGNHEQMFLDALVNCGVIAQQRLADQSKEWAKEISRYSDVTVFKLNGGNETLKSYGVEMVQEFSGFTLLGEIPQEHIDFIQQTRLLYQVNKYIFVHAGVDPDVPLDKQNPYVLLWDRNLSSAPAGKTVVIGHTPCPEGDAVDCR